MKLKCNDGVTREFHPALRDDFKMISEAQCLECGTQFGYGSTASLKNIFKKHICAARKINPTVTIKE